MKCELCNRSMPDYPNIGQVEPASKKRCFRCDSLEAAIHADPEIAQDILKTMKCETEPVSTRLLVWRGRHGAQAFMARTDIELKQAYLILFKIINNECFYDHLDESQMSYYDSATEGDAAAAKCLIELRSDLGHQYEDVRVEHTEVPQ